MKFSCSKKGLIAIVVGAWLLAGSIAFVILLNRPPPDARDLVEFRGVILDQDGAGVASATVGATLVFYEDKEMSGGVVAPKAEYRELITDAEGRFSFRGQFRSVSLDFKDTGSLQFPEFENVRTVFGPNEFSKEPGRPHVFSVWRRSVAEPLISEILTFDIPIDQLRLGTEYAIDLLKCKASKEVGGDLVIDISEVSVKPSSIQEIVANLTVVDGGLYVTEEFVFLAAEDGYASTWQFDSRSPDNRMVWKNELHRTFFVRSRKGEVFSKIRFGVFLTDRGARVEVKYLCNPRGSRNLQFDPSKRVFVPG